METYSIGRAKGNDIIINKESISTRHALIIVDDDEVFLEDANSTNGVFVNRRRIQKCKLYPNDEILIANVIFDLSKNFRILDNKIVAVKPIDDFTHEFNELREIEINYEARIDKINNNSTFYMILFRLSAMMGAISGIVLRMIIKEKNLIYILTSTLFFGLVSLFAYLKADKKNKEKEKEKKIVRDEFRADFVCPSCNFTIQDSIYMMQLKDEYRCKSCKALIYKKSNNE